MLRTYEIVLLDYISLFGLVTMHHLYFDLYYNGNSYITALEFGDCEWTN